MPASDTQCSSILAALREAAGRELSMPFLSRVSGSLNVHSRIADLRRRGHSIPPARIVSQGRLRTSFYRLETNP